MKRNIFLGIVLSFIFVLLLTPVPDPATQLTYACFAVFIYVFFATIGFFVFPSFRDKKKGLWLALGIPLLLVLILRILYLRGN